MTLSPPYGSGLSAKGCPVGFSIYYYCCARRTYYVVLFYKRYKSVPQLYRPNVRHLSPRGAVLSFGPCPATRPALGREGSCTTGATGREGRPPWPGTRRRRAGHSPRAKLQKRFARHGGGSCSPPCIHSTTRAPPEQCLQPTHRRRAEAGTPLESDALKSSGEGAASAQPLARAQSEVTLRATLKNQPVPLAPKAVSSETAGSPGWPATAVLASGGMKVSRAPHNPRSDAGRCAGGELKPAWGRPATTCSRAYSLLHTKAQPYAWQCAEAGAGQGRTVRREVGRDPAGGALISGELEEESAPVGETSGVDGAARDAPGWLQGIGLQASPEA